MPSVPKSALTNHQKVCVETNKPLMATGFQKNISFKAINPSTEKKRNKVVKLQLRFFQLLKKIENSLIKWAFCVQLEKQYPSHAS